MVNIEKIATSLKEIEKKSKKVEVVACRLALVQSCLLQNLCKSLEVTKSALLRGAFGHWCSYIDSLNPEELKQELIRMKKFCQRNPK